MIKTEVTDRSSNVKQVSFNDETNELEVTFKNGSKYAYEDVPEKIFESMTKAESVGKYFIANVKNSYKYHRV